MRHIGNCLQIWQAGDEYLWTMCICHILTQSNRDNQPEIRTIRLSALLMVEYKKMLELPRREPQNVMCDAVVCCVLPQHKTRFLHVQYSVRRDLCVLLLFGLSLTLLWAFHFTTVLFMWSEMRENESQGHAKGYWSENYEGFGHALSPTSLGSSRPTSVGRPTSVVVLPTSVLIVNLRR